MKQKEKKIEIIFIGLIWLFVFLAPFLFREQTGTIRWAHIYNLWTNNAVIFLLFLLNRYMLLPQLFFKGKKWLYLISIISLLSISSAGLSLRGEGELPLPNPEMRPLVLTLQQKQNPPLRDIQNNKRKPPTSEFVVMCLLVLGLDTCLAFYTKWASAEKKKSLLREENLENKMAILKNQISPHFFMNTLNNIHALIDIDTVEAKTAIIKLSKIMGYMLYDSRVPSTPLNKEIAFIESYVDLMRFRFSKEIEITFKVQKNMPEVSIPPLLTISFIENAFKYGISYDTLSYVRIYIKISNNHLIFNCENSKHEYQKKTAHSGIGLANAKNRLELIYGKKHQLFIDDSDKHSYKVHLNIPL